MATLGRYCKAYPVRSLRAFPNWPDKTGGLRRTDSGSPESEPKPLSDDDYLFVHDNFIVTGGIFIDQNIILDEVSPEWRLFCEQSLGFVVPPTDAIASHEATETSVSIPNS